MKGKYGFIPGLVAVALLGFASNASAALVSITGGTAGNIEASNSVLGPAGIGQNPAGNLGIFTNGTLNLSQGVFLTLYDVGNEGGWGDRIVLGNVAGPALNDSGNNPAGFVNANWWLNPVGTVQQNAGVASIQFWRDTGGNVALNPLFLVANGASPNVPIGTTVTSSIAFAYLDANNQIVTNATDRILVMLDDGGKADDNHDDYVGILVATPVPLPAAAWLLISGLIGLGAFGRRRTV